MPRTPIQVILTPKLTRLSHYLQNPKEILKSSSQIFLSVELEEEEKVIDWMSYQGRMSYSPSESFYP